MSDINPNALSLEEPSIETPPTQQPAVEPDAQSAPDDAEPEGVVEHQGRRMVDVSVLAAERRRVREATERAIREKELTPLQAKAQKADALEAALAEVRPIIDQVRQYGLPKAPEPTSLEQQIPNDRAERYARRFELYDAKSGQPDIARAKAILAEQQQDIQEAARAAAQAAVGPITSQTAQQASKQNFVQMAMQRDGNDQPLVDAKVLAEFWASLPPELTAHPEVGELVLNAAIGKSVRTKGHVARPERAPIVSEPAGGRSGPQWQMDRMAKQIAQHAGISDKAFSDSAKTYQPGAVNILGD